MMPVATARAYVSHRLSNEQPSFPVWKNFWMMTTTTTTTTTASSTITTMRSPTMGFQSASVIINTLTRPTKETSMHDLSKLFHEVTDNSKHSVKHLQLFTNHTIQMLTTFVILAVLCLLLASVVLVLSSKVKRLRRHKSVQRRTDIGLNDSTTSSIFMHYSSWPRKQHPNNVKEMQATQTQTVNQTEPVVYYSTIPYIDHYLLPQPLLQFEEERSKKKLKSIVNVDYTFYFDHYYQFREMEDRPTKIYVPATTKESPYCKLIYWSQMLQCIPEDGDHAEANGFNSTLETAPLQGNSKRLLQMMVMHVVSDELDTVDGLQRLRPVVSACAKRRRPVRK